MLARFLSQKAAELRSQMSEDELKRSMDGEDMDADVMVPAATNTPNTAKLSAELELRVFSELGDGGFVSDDFEIVQRLGSVSILRANREGSGAQPQAAVIAYAARYIPRMPYMRPCPTLLKEYLPVAKPVAFNELLLVKHLCGIPEDKARAADELPSPDPPVVPLLGYFATAPSEDAAALSTDLEQDSVWLVYKWEGLRPLNMYLDAGPPKAQGGLFKKKEVAEAEAWARRRDMLRAIARQLLAAVDFIHAADVVHGSLSSGSILMSASEDCDPDDLVVKLDSFGFGKWFTATPALMGSAASGSSIDGAGYGPISLGEELEEGKRVDLQAAALVLAEAFVTMLAASPAGVLSRPSLQRLLFGVYAGDYAAFRNYCLEDASGSFARFVAFMDEGGEAQGGWSLLRALLAGDASALQLSQHPFLALGQKPARRIL